MKKNNTLLILFIILGLSILSQFFFFKGNKVNLSGNNIKDEVQRDNSLQRESNKIILDFGDGRKITQDAKAQTAFEALQILSSAKGYKIISKQYKYGLIVEEVNKVKNSAQKSWLYFVNGKLGNIAADRYILTSNDVIEWKYSIVK